MSGSGLDMSGNPYWNPAKGPDMSGSVAGHVRQDSLEPGQEAGYVRADRRFWWRIDLDYLHFTNSLRHPL
jgi:hypothetical protein